VDALVAGIVGIVIFASMTVAAEPSSRRVDLLAYLLGLAAGLLLLVRRRWPVPVLAASALLIVTYHVLDYPAIGLAFPLVAALYSAAVSAAHGGGRPPRRRAAQPAGAGGVDAGGAACRRGRARAGDAPTHGRGTPAHRT
jgi:hypothetical protein